MRNYVSQEQEKSTARPTRQPILRIIISEEIVAINKLLQYLL
jgi:hypothetical protein